MCNDIIFNHLINNVDDHLHNIGILYVGRKQWARSPAFDLNPFPDKDPESKTWLSEDTGPVTSLAQCLSKATSFELQPDEAMKALAEVTATVQGWRAMALCAEVGLTAHELPAFAKAFEGKA